LVNTYLYNEAKAKNHPAQPNFRLPTSEQELTKKQTFSTQNEQENKKGEENRGNSS